jgi:hypothetical protein
MHACWALLRSAPTYKSRYLNPAVAEANQLATLFDNVPLISPVKMPTLGSAVSINVVWAEQHGQWLPVISGNLGHPSF